MKWVYGKCSLANYALPRQPKVCKKMYLLEKTGFSKQIRFLIKLAPKAHLGSLDIICILWLPKSMRHAASP